MSKPLSDYEPWYTLQEFADEHRVSLSTVKNWCKDPSVLRKVYLGATDSIPRISGVEAKRFDDSRSSGSAR